MLKLVEKQVSVVETETIPIMIMPQKQFKSSICQTEPPIQETSLVEPTGLLLPVVKEPAPLPLSTPAADPIAELELPQPLDGKDWSDSPLYHNLLC